MTEKSPLLRARAPSQDAPWVGLTNPWVGFTNREMYDETFLRSVCGQPAVRALVGGVMGFLAQTFVLWGNRCPASLSRAASLLAG